MKTVIATPSDREISMTRSFDAPRELVWEAYTDPRYVRQWLLGPEGWTMPVCEIDLHPGGPWRYVWRKEDGQEMEMRGAYREVQPPSRVVWTESWGPEWPETVNTLTLTEEGGRTSSEIRILYPSKELRDKAAATGMASGSEISYDRLDGLLKTMA